LRTGWNDDSIQFSLFPLFIIICFTFIVFVEINISDGIALFLSQAVEVIDEAVDFSLTSAS